MYDSLYEGMTKQQSSEHEIHRLQVALAEFNQQFHALRHGTGDEAQAMLTIIRQYAQVDGLGDGTQSKSVSGSVTSFRCVHSTARLPPCCPAAAGNVNFIWAVF